MNPRLPLALLSVLSASATVSAQIDFDPAVSYAAGQRPDTSVLTDLNGDGILDLATTADNAANNDVLALRFGNGDGTFGARVDFFLGNSLSASAVTAADIDGDGDNDIVVTYRSPAVAQILLGDGAGNLSFGGQTAVGNRPVAIVAFDLEGDGDPDFAVSNRDGNSVTVLTNVAGSLSAQTIAVGDEPRGVDAGDLNADGIADLAVGVHDDRNVQVLFGNGTGFTNGPTLSVGAQRRPEGVAIADLDGDGDADLAAATSGNGFNSVSVWLVTAGSFAGPVHWATAGVDPSWVSIGDYDADGIADLAVAESDSGTVSALRGTGGGAFGAAQAYAAGISSEHLVQGDLDGNGSLDLVCTNRDSGDVAVLVNRNGGASSWEDLGFGLAGSLGVPTLSGSGALRAGATVTVRAAQGLPNGSAVLFLGSSTLFAPFKGGTMVPDPTFIWFGQALDASGQRTYVTTWPGNVPAGTQFVLQMWIFDGNAVEGLAATNGLRGTAE